MRRGGPLPFESEKRRAQRPERERVRRLVFARDGRCVARERVPEVSCWGPWDADEIRPRSRGGDPLDPQNVQTLCRAHHDWKHSQPAEAVRRGLAISDRPYN